MSAGNCRSLYERQDSILLISRSMRSQMCSFAYIGQPSFVDIDSDWRKRRITIRLSIWHCVAELAKRQNSKIFTGTSNCTQCLAFHDIFSTMSRSLLGYGIRGRFKLVLFLSSPACVLSCLSPLGIPRLTSNSLGEMHRLCRR